MATPLYVINILLSAGSVDDQVIEPHMIIQTVATLFMVGVVFGSLIALIVSH